MAREKKNNVAYFGKLADDLQDAIQELADEERRSFSDMTHILLEIGVHVRQFKLRKRLGSTRILNDS